MLLISSMMTTVLPRRHRKGTDLAALRGTDQIDDLDAGGEHLGDVDCSRVGVAAVDGIIFLRLDRPAFVSGLPHT